MTVGGGIARCWRALAGWRAAIGSEFLPHLDEGAIWVRGTLAPSTGPTEGIRVANQARVILAAFPEVNMTTSQVGVRTTAPTPPASSTPNISST